MDDPRTFDQRIIPLPHCAILILPGLLHAYMARIEPHCFVRTAEYDGIEFAHL